MDMRRYDLVIANTSAFIHGVSVGPRTVLVSYCHSPFRYVWTHYESLLRARSGILAPGMLVLSSACRRWDLRAARRVNLFITPSRYISERIRLVYGRDSVVIPPSVDTDVFRPVQAARGEYFLVVSPLMRWKRVDIAVEAFNWLKLPLRIVGDGEERRRLERAAQPNIEFIGPTSAFEGERLARFYSDCRALILTSEEDFGLAAIEAMACGRPVIALAAGGALETVVGGKTGVLFPEQTAQSLAAAIKERQYDVLETATIRSHAEQFSTERFASQILMHLQEYGLRLDADGVS